MSETLSLAQAKAHLSELIRRVYSQHVRVTVPVHGRPSAVTWLSRTACNPTGDTPHQLAAFDAEPARGDAENAESLEEAWRHRRERPVRRSLRMLWRTR
jgi:antitoxin YefM